MGLRIGTLRIDPAVLMAPMAGITDSPYRRVLRSLGCPAVVTEMVSSEGLIRQGRGSLALLEHQPDEHPLLVQIFGAKADAMAESARMVESAGFAGIDINMGCPVPKVVKNGAGAALMRDPPLAEEVVRAVRRASRLPLSVKIRAGWTHEERNAVELAQRLEQAGADAIVIHPHTRAQGYRGVADWDLIGQVVRAIRIPVIGNGDLRVPVDGTRMREETGCAGVMVGRAALGDPWIPAAMAGRCPDYPPGHAERFRVFCMHLDFMLASLDSEERAVRRMRKHLAWYSQGLRGAAGLRRNLQDIHTADEMREAFSRLESERT